MSQQKVATASGTSQSAIARIESAQENITLDTLQRLIRALDGRFYVSIQPQELPYRQELPWWESLSIEPSTWGNWNVKAVASKQTGDSHEVLMLIQRYTSNSTSGAFLPPIAIY
jgi:transcriptional regulator with XRE-family HTH domain